MSEWVITDTKDFAFAFDDYMQEVLSSTPPALPANDQTIGHVETHWHQVKPGLVFVASNPEQGTADDRTYAEQIVMAQLVGHGFKRLTWSLYPEEHKTAGWGDIQAKARRLIQEGKVRILRNGANNIMAHVIGDHGEYDPEIKRDDPNSLQITGSHCGCDWGKFQNLPRTRQWKRFQDRPCAHILAAYWQALSTPLDEDRAPGDQGDEGQMSLPGMSPADMGGMQAPSTMPTMQNSPTTPPNAWFNGDPTMGPDQGFSGGGAGIQAPTPEQALPQFPGPPMDQALNGVSIPGGKPGPTALNPLQFPGGTYSRVSATGEAPMYANGDRVQLLHDEHEATLLGDSEQHGAGQYTRVPAKSIGEVLGVHPATGLVNVLYSGKQFENNGELMPWGAQAWHFPSSLKLRNDLRPAPGIRKR
jgi:hypothetical protein